MANFQKIKILCKSQGITLSDLAKEIGITPTGLGLIIQNNKTMTDKLEDIAKVLNVRVGVFFDEDEPMVADNPATNKLDTSDILAQKDAIIAQKDKIIEQKDAIINKLLSQ